MFGCLRKNVNWLQLQVAFSVAESHVFRCLVAFAIAYALIIIAVVEKSA